MANSTYFVTTNKILVSMGQVEIASTTVFDSGTLTKTQKQAKHFVDEANRLLALDVNGEFRKKTGTITTSSGTTANNNGYALATDAFFESCIEDSWFVTTSGYGRQLDIKGYEQWVSEDPDGHTVTGIPGIVIPKPAAAGGTTDKVHFEPVPNGVYTVQYSYYLIPAPLALAADTIIWPPYLEPLLWEAVRVYMQEIMGDAEQAKVTFAQHFTPYLMKVKQKTLGFSQIPPRMDMGFTVGNSMRRGRRLAWPPPTPD